MLLPHPLMVVIMVVVMTASGEERQGRHHHRSGSMLNYLRRARDITLHDLPGTITPERHEDEAARVGLMAVGEAGGRRRECPAPPPFREELCAARACLHHHRCPPRKACCFNGCVHTCLTPMDPPPVFDWVEDTGSLLPLLGGGGRPEEQLPVRYEEELSFAEGREEAVHLPGGCTITGSQFNQLQDLMKAPSIDNCTCKMGEVVCAVKMLKS